VEITDLGSVTASPGNNPVVLAATALSAGTDDRGAVTTATMIAALENAGRELDGSAVAVPGYSVDVIGEDLLAHAAEYKKVALMSFAAETTLAEAIATEPVTDTVNGSYGAVIFPHVVVPDGNGTRTVSPEGYAAAARARAHASTGFWQAPPGDRSLARWVVGTSLPLDIVDIEALDENKVNGIITMANRPRLYGWASLSEDRDSFALLSTRDTLNNVGARLRRELEEFVFSTIDGKGHLLSKVESAATGVLANVAAAGGFYPRFANGERVDPGYSVTVDETINTASSLANNEVRVGIGVRLSPMAKSIFVEIIKVPLNASV
jgi:phage tail sheath protein FI